MKAAPAFLNALRALEELKRLGVVEDYAIAGAMALVFWTEPIPTYDLDVLVLLAEQETPIVSLGSIYQWAAAHGYPVDGEHIAVEGLPVQFLPSHNELADEAIERAATLDYEGVAVRVVRPEYLVAALPRTLGANVQTPGTCCGADRGPGDGSESRPGSDPSIQAGAIEMGHRSRPTPELMSRLRQGKAELRARRTQMSLKEKVAMVLELQRIYYPLLKRHRQPASWERPWEIEP